MFTHLRLARGWHFCIADVYAGETGCITGIPPRWKTAAVYGYVWLKESFRLEKYLIERIQFIATAYEYGPHFFLS